MSETLAGARLVTACEAMLTPGSSRFLPELGIPPSVGVELPAVARMVVAESHSLMLVYSRVESSPPILIIARQLNAPAQIRALDSLLEIAATYVAGHEQNLAQFLWESSVLHRLRSPLADELSSLSEGARSALTMAVRAFDAGLELVREIIQSADQAGASQLPYTKASLEALAAIIGRKCFLATMRRIRRSLSDDELASFVTWASQSAGQPLKLPNL